MRRIGVLEGFAESNREGQEGAGCGVPGRAQAAWMDRRPQHPDRHPLGRARRRDGGFIDGKDVRVEYRWASGEYDQLPGLAKELVGLPVSVLAASGGESTVLAAKAATSTIGDGRLAVGGALAQREAQRMVAEKVTAFAEAQGGCYNQNGL
jgi:hypothetical protein